LTLRAFDPLGALAALARHQVRFVLIGGLAARLRGSPSITDDLDVCHSAQPSNLDALAGALRAINARLRGAEEVDFPLDERFLAGGRNFTFATDHGALDCLAEPAGVAGYEELIADADEVDLGDFAISVASVEALMKMKKAAGRPKDLIELEVLGALKKELDHLESGERR
jgi:hypothetical protein